MKSNLVPTTTVDKNGKRTTVYKRPAGESIARKPFWSLPRREEASRSDLVAALKSEISSYGNHKLHGNMTSIRTSSLQGMLSVLSHESSSSDTYIAFATRYDSCDKRHFVEWVDEFSSRYEEIREWNEANGKPHQESLVAAVISSTLTLRDNEGSHQLSPAEETSMLRLRIALISSGLGKFSIMETNYGQTLMLDEQEYLTGFVASHPAPEDIAKAEELIVYRKVNHLEDISTVIDKDVSTSISDGVL